MKVKDFDSLFIHQVKDLYSAEKQLLKLLPKLAKKASNEDLRQAFQHHADESQQQIERLEKILGELDISTRGAKCPGMEGIVEEAKELLEGQMESDALDAALICAAQRAEHYEIAGYGCVRSLAQQIGRNDLAEEFQRTLDEEHQANQRLNDIALSHVNRQAAQEGDGHQGEQSSLQTHNGHGQSQQREGEQSGPEMMEEQHVGAGQE